MSAVLFAGQGPSRSLDRGQDGGSEGALGEGEGGNREDPIAGEGEGEGDGEEEQDNPLKASEDNRGGEAVRTGVGGGEEEE